jgi:pseudouridine-5'-phosphate glycosidase
MMRAKWDLGLSGGIAVANPVPADEEMPTEEVGALIEQALGECADRGIHGKDITPFLLGRIVELSGGRSLETNIALVRSNARLGAALAVAWQRLS